MSECVYVYLGHICICMSVFVCLCVYVFMCCMTCMYVYYLMSDLRYITSPLLMALLP